MIKHIVLLKWLDDVSDEQITDVCDGLSQLVAELEYIVSYEYGPDSGLLANDYDYGLVAEFENEQEFRSYLADPQHLALLARIKPLLAATTSLQFDC